jgi:hypothetical protein
MAKLLLDFKSAASADFAIRAWAGVRNVVSSLQEARQFPGIAIAEE